MATKSTKNVSLVAQIEAENPELFGGVQFTDDIFIPFPSKRQCESIVDAKNEMEITEILLGDQMGAIEDVLAELPLGASVKALASLVMALREGIPDFEQTFKDAGMSDKELQEMFADKLGTKE